LVVKRGRCIRMITSPPSVSRLSRQCGILSISQPYRPPQSVTGIALLFYELYVCRTTEEVFSVCMDAKSLALTSFVFKILRSDVWCTKKFDIFFGLWFWYLFLNIPFVINLIWIVIKYYHCNLPVKTDKNCRKIRARWSAHKGRFVMHIWLIQARRASWLTC
jgi:hypothetical protein